MGSSYKLSTILKINYLFCDSNEKENIFETRIIDLTETYNIGKKVLSETYVPLSIYLDKF